MATLKDTVRSALRKSERVQDLYEHVKNRERAPILRRVLPHHAVGAELGVHKGHLSGKLIDWTEPRRFYAVDPWELLGDEWEWAAGEKSTVKGRLRATEGIRKHIESGVAEVVVADDLEWLRSLDDGTLDWVYVDTSHAYEHTLAELDLLVEKVRPGGVIAGDDWRSDPSHRHHGVCKAVREFAADGRIELFLVDERSQQWAARNTAH